MPTKLRGIGNIISVRFFFCSLLCFDMFHYLM